MFWVRKYGHHDFYIALSMLIPWHVEADLMWFEQEAWKSLRFYSHQSPSSRPLVIIATKQSELSAEIMSAPASIGLPRCVTRNTLIKVIILRWKVRAVCIKCWGPPPPSGLMCTWRRLYHKPCQKRRCHLFRKSELVRNSSIGQLEEE